jgi:hypothetical protein
MDKIGIDVRQAVTQVCVLTETGEYEACRIPTERDALQAFFGASADLAEAATESEWVARQLESMGDECSWPTPTSRRCMQAEAARSRPTSDERLSLFGGRHAPLARFSLRARARCEPERLMRALGRAGCALHLDRGRLSDALYCSAGAMRSALRASGRRARTSSGVIEPRFAPCKCGRLRCICVQVFEVASVARPPRKRETEA